MDWVKSADGDGGDGMQVDAPDQPGQQDESHTQLADQTVRACMISELGVSVEAVAPMSASLTIRGTAGWQEAQGRPDGPQGRDHGPA